MRLPAATVRATCRLMLAVMLFAQWAVAAYACEGPLAMQAAQTAAHETAAMLFDCDMAKTKASKDTLCLEHCRFGQQSSDTSPTPTVLAAAPVFLYALPVASIEGAAQGQRPSAPVDHPGAPPPPPHAILHCVWRI